VAILLINRRTWLANLSSLASSTTREEKMVGRRVVKRTRIAGRKRDFMADFINPIAVMSFSTSTIYTSITEFLIMMSMTEGNHELPSGVAHRVGHSRMMTYHVKIINDAIILYLKKN